MSEHISRGGHRLVGFGDTTAPDSLSSPTSTRTSTEVRSPTSTSTEVRSPTSTSTEVRSPTNTSTEAYTADNFTATVTGGAGAGATTTVNIYPIYLDRKPQSANGVPMFPGHEIQPPQTMQNILREVMSTPPPTGVMREMVQGVMSTPPPIDVIQDLTRETMGVGECSWYRRLMDQKISLGGRPLGVGGEFRYEGLRLPGLDGPSNLIIAASKPPPPPPPPDPPPAQDYDSIDDGSLGLSGFNVMHVIGAPVKLAGHALAPLARAAGKTGIPQWTNRHLIKPIVEPGLKLAALAAVDVESAGIHTLINTFVPSPVKELLHGLTSVAVDEIKRGINGAAQLSPKAIVDTMIQALTFLGSATSVIQAIVDAAFEMKMDGATIPYLFANWAPPPGKTLSKQTQAELTGAQLTFNNALPGPIKGILTSVVSLISDIATTGKIRQSDLKSIVGNGKVVDRIMDLFGIHDDPPPAALANIMQVAPPAMRPAMKKAASAALFAAATGQPHLAANAANTMLAAHPATRHLHPHRPAPPQAPHHHHHRPHGPIQPGAYAPYPTITS